MLLKLLADADVLIENFKTGTMEKWGIGYDALSEKFPRLVHARVSGFGADGPLGGFPGYDAMVQASAGLVSVNGSPEGGPVRIGVPVVDLSTGMNACIGILMVLYERNRSGKGQFVDATLYDSAIALHQPHAPNYFMAGQKPKLFGNSHGNLAPYANFPTKGRNIVIGAGNDGQFRKLVPDAGQAGDGRRSALQDQQGPARAQGRDGSRAACAHQGPRRRVLRQRADAERRAVGRGAGGAGRDGAPPYEAPQHGLGEGRLSQCRQPGEAVAHAARVRSKPKKFGLDTRAVLAECGYSAAEIDTLVASGVALTEIRKA